MSVFQKNSHAKSIPPDIKDFVVKCLKQGERTIKIKVKAKKKFNKYISLQAVYRIREEYIQITGEHVPCSREFNKLKIDEVKK